MWTKERLLEEAQKQVKQMRFTHILGVIETAIQLSKQFEVDPDQAEIAAILHDYCKAWGVERMKEVLLAHNDSSWLSYPAQTWHAPAAVYVIRKEFGIIDHDVLTSIYYHTTGRAGMSPLEKVIWVADYIEPNREFPGVEQARQLAETDLDAALRYGLTQTIEHLVVREQPIHPLTIEAYNYYQNRR